MLLTQTNRLKLNNAESEALKQLCHLSKNMFNVGLYNVRQYFFQERKYLRYEGNYHLSKENENYKLLATDIAQQTLKVVDRSFRSFFNLLKAQPTASYKAKVRLPGYLPKDDYFLLIIPMRPRDWDKISKRHWLFNIPMSREFRSQYGSVSIQIPERLRSKTVKEIRILPKFGGKCFEVSYVYESGIEPQVEKTGEILGIDLGLDNLTACVSSIGESFIIDGKRLKSINQFFNKQNARLQSFKDLQKFGKKLTSRQSAILDNRNHKVNDYLNKAARYIVDWCRDNGISKIVVGYNPTLKQGVNMGSRNNQNFTHIPIFTLKRKLQSLCERYGIEWVEQEESYTSKASSLDGDALATWNADNPVKYEFSGKRIKRGLYRTAEGGLINADCNGALNIIRKHTSKLDEFLGEFKRCLAQPLRVTIS